MNDQLNAGSAGFFETTISLKQLVSNLVCNSLPAALHHKSNVVNEVEQGVLLGAGKQKVKAILQDLLTTVISNSCNGEIHISADRFRDVVTLEIQERNNNNGYALAYSIGSIEPDAAAVGGHISMKGCQQKVATIFFSFPDLFAA